MKTLAKWITTAILSIASMQAIAFNSEIFPIELSDGVTTTVRLALPEDGLFDLEERFRACQKSNLKIFVFDKHNHDLNFQEWIATKTYSEGLQKLFETSAEI
jgi:hypothetical protein